MYIAAGVLTTEPWLPARVMKRPSTEHQHQYNVDTCTCIQGLSLVHVFNIIHISVDSSQTVLEHHRSFAPFDTYIVHVHVSATSYVHVHFTIIIYM